MVEKNADIFISYRRKAGGLETAGRIRDRLKELGYTVFMDLHNMEKGKKFPPQIKNAIERCKDFVLVLPPDAEDSAGKLINALESYWVRYEICYALSLNKHIIPVQMEGYSYPQKENFPSIPEEFKFLDIEEKFNSLDEIDGLIFYGEVFDECFIKLKKSLISKRKWNVKKKIAVVSAILGISLCGLVTGKIIYNSYLPSFSVSILQNEYENDSWNVGYVISNKDDGLSNGSVTPRLRLAIKLISKYDNQKLNENEAIIENEAELYDKQGSFEVEFYDFYDNKSYFFDDKNNSVTILESNADKLVYYLEKLEENLEKNNIYIDMYSVQTVFEIKYIDQFRIKHVENYELENNYAFMWTPWGSGESEYEGLQRYIGDNMLVRADNDIQEDVSEKINMEEHELDFYIKDDAKYINKHRDKILKTNIYSSGDAENSDNDGYVPIMLGGGEEVSDLIEDENGFISGVHFLHDNCLYQELEWYKVPIAFLKELFRW